MSSRRRRTGRAPIAVEGQRILKYARRQGVVKWVEGHTKERSAARRVIRLAIKDQQDEQKEAQRLARALRISGDPAAMVQTANSELLSVELRLGLVASWVEMYPQLFTGRADDLVRISESIADIALQIVQRLEGRGPGAESAPPPVPLALPPAHDGPQVTNGDAAHDAPEVAHEQLPGRGAAEEMS